MLAGEVVDAVGDARRRAGASSWPRRSPGPRREGVLFSAAPEGDDDEGLRPDHLRPRGAGVLRRGVRRVRRHARRRATSARTTASARCCSTPASLPARAPRDRSRDRRRPGRAARASRWSTPTAASPTCTCRPTSSSTPRCRRMIRTCGQHVGPRTASEDDTLAVIPDQLVRRRSTRRSSTTAAPTARSTRPRWARCRTSA